MSTTTSGQINAHLTRAVGKIAAFVAGPVVDWSVGETLPPVDARPIAKGRVLHRTWSVLSSLGFLWVIGSCDPGDPAPTNPSTESLLPGEVGAYTGATGTGDCRLEHDRYDGNIFPVPDSMTDEFWTQQVNFHGNPLIERNWYVWTNGKCGKRRVFPGLLDPPPNVRLAWTTAIIGGLEVPAYAVYYYYSGGSIGDEPVDENDFLRFQIGLFEETSTGGMIQHDRADATIRLRTCAGCYENEEGIEICISGPSWCTRFVDWGPQGDER